MVRLPCLLKDDQLSGCSFIHSVGDAGGEGLRAAIRTTAGNPWDKKFYLWVQREMTLEVHVGIQGLLALL